MKIQLEKSFQKNLQKGKFQKVQKHLEKRLEEMKSAENLDEFARTYPGAHLHERFSDQTMFTVNLTGNWRLCFRPGELEQKEDKGIDLKSVTTIIIFNIDDPH